MEYRHTNPFTCGAVPVASNRPVVQDKELLPISALDFNWRLTALPIRIHRLHQHNPRLPHHLHRPDRQKTPGCASTLR